LRKRTTPLIKFFNDVEENTKKNNVKLIIKDDYHIDIDGFSVSGYYCPEDKELVVALGHPSWLGILVHEYCHFLQDISKKCKAWSNCYIDGEDCCGLFFSWLDGDDIEYDIDNVVDRVKYMELDCEKKSVQTIKKYKLPINIEEYIRYAVAYIHFYNVSKKTRKWVKKGYSMTKDKKLLNMVKPTLNQDFDIVPKKVFNYINRYAI